VKKLIASRVAAKLEAEDGVATRLAKGRLSELRVTIDDETVFRGNPLWYPMPSSVVREVRAALSQKK
jgi:hypothetical protein